MTEIIKFPTNKIVRDVTLPLEELELLKKKGRKNIADVIVSEISSGLYNELEQYGLDTSGNKFKRDFLYTIDVLRSIVYRTMKLDHPLHAYIENSVKLYKKTEDGEMVPTDDLPDSEDLSDYDFSTMFKQEED